jgi:hypothetical protein
MPVVLLKLVPDMKGRTQAEGVWEQGAEKNIWAKEGWINGRLQETA